MPLDASSYLRSQGWGGKGQPLRPNSNGLRKPIIISQKVTLGGVGKDRDEAFAFWDHVYAASAKTIQIKLHSDSDTEDSASQPTSMLDSISLAHSLERTSTGLLSNRLPSNGIAATYTPSSSGSSTPLSNSYPGPSSQYRPSLLATAKREAAKQGLYRKFYRGPVILMTEEDQNSHPSSTEVDGVVEDKSGEPSPSPQDDARLLESSTLVVDEQAAKEQEARVAPKTDRRQKEPSREERRRRKEERRAKRLLKKQRKIKEAMDSSSMPDSQTNSSDPLSREESSKSTKRKLVEVDSSTEPPVADTHGREIKPSKKRRKLESGPSTAMVVPERRLGDETRNVPITRRLVKKVTFCETVQQLVVARWLPQIVRTAFCDERALHEIGICDADKDRHDVNAGKKVVCHPSPFILPPPTTMSSTSNDAILSQILAQLEALQASQAQLQSKLDSLQAPISPSSSRIATPPKRTAGLPIPTRTDSPSALVPNASSYQSAILSTSPPVPSVSGQTAIIGPNVVPTEKTSVKDREKGLYPQRVIITSYPDQTGIKPVPLHWGAESPAQRGPVICSRTPSSIKVRNAIGAHSGSYSIYRALAIAIGTLDPTHKPNYALTEPPVDIPPQPSWSDPKKIVSFDPWGHLAAQVFKDQLDAGLDVRPSIAITKAHIKMSELDVASVSGALKVDGKIVLQSIPLKDEHGDPMPGPPGVELVTSKAAVEPVWYLPGVAERFGISESLLRRALFEDTGGMYPELITRPDIKVFLPPIGGLTVYIFGPPAYLSDESKELTVRVHDECNGSDVFGSDICTCKPYLVFAIEEAVRCAQRGGVGLVVYFRKEGRALGEVTKYLVYNLRKRGGDSADKYFKSTEMIAGVKDMRFQALMPDVLHWLGIKKIDNMVSMSDMKYNAIVDSGIPILKRYDIPEHLIPPDSRVEIDAKIAAGYFTSGKKVTEADLIKTVGRTWEEAEH